MWNYTEGLTLYSFFDQINLTNGIRKRTYFCFATRRPLFGLITSNSFPILTSPIPSCQIR